MNIVKVNKKTIEAMGRFAVVKKETNKKCVFCNHYFVKNDKYFKWAKPLHARFCRKCFSAGIGMKREVFLLRKREYYQRNKIQNKGFFNKQKINK